MTLEPRITVQILSSFAEQPLNVFWPSNVLRFDRQKGSDRAGNVPREEVLRDSMSFADWLRTVIPGGMTHQQFIPIVYLGIVPALLALMGIWDRRARGWLLLLAFSIVISAGSGELLTRLPLTIIRYPARVVPLGGLAIAALAVIGLRRVERFSWIPLIAIALIDIDREIIDAALDANRALEHFEVVVDLMSPQDGLRRFGLVR